MQAPSLHCNRDRNMSRWEAKRRLQAPGLYYQGKRYVSSWQVQGKMPRLCLFRQKAYGLVNQCVRVGISTRACRAFNTYVSM